MSTMQFKKAQRSQSNLRLALSGPSGAGKTFTSLSIASGLGGRVCMLDTERGRGALYGDLFEFDSADFCPPYDPRRLITALREAEEGGYDVCIIDSLSHFWNGPGGLLEMVEEIATKMKTRNNMVAWRKATPLQQAMVDAIVSSKMHIIACMRSKQEYALERDEKGRTTVTKLGLAPVQRDGTEFEFDIFGEIDIDHNLVITKTRCFELTDAVINKPGKGLGEQLAEWLKGGK